MSLFVVTYTHPDEKGWNEHMVPHIDYLEEITNEGSLIASGP